MTNRIDTGSYTETSSPPPADSTSCIVSEDSIMNDLLRRNRARHRVILAALGILGSVGGCGPTYRELRQEGQRAMVDGAYGLARGFFLQAEEHKPRRVTNLHDLGACSVMLARRQFERMNHTAARREVESALAYYERAIDVHPGHQASLEGKAIALKLKGQFDEALRHAEWAAEFVGPSARQYLFLAGELDERGDTDGAYLRFRQAVAVEPDAVEAHRTFAKFLLRNEQESAAVFHLQIAYRLDPADPWVMEELVARGALPPLAPTDEKAR